MSEVDGALVEVGKKRFAGGRELERSAGKPAGKLCTEAVAVGYLGDSRGDGVRQGIDPLLGGRTGVDFGLGEFGHDVDRAAAGEVADIYQRVGNCGRERVDLEAEPGEGGDRVAAVLGISPGVGLPAVNFDFKDGGGRARPHHRPGFPGGVEDETELVPGGLGCDDSGRIDGADLFVGRQ